MPRQCSPNVVIMAKKVVEVRECDRCGHEPAHQWTITGPDGTVRAIDLCDRHGAMVANAFAFAQPATNRHTRPGLAHRAPHPPIDLPATPPTQPERNWR
jgi:hypothetical protein